MRRPSESVSSSPAARRRLRRLAVVMAIVVAAAGAGFAVGDRVRSPAEAAADRDPPPASPVSVPVERRSLSNDLTRRGSVRFDNPTPLALAGPVGGDAGAQIVTRTPDAGAQVAEGDAFVDVNGRPVFALAGARPMYRSLRPGDLGDDVLQLERALERLGFTPGVVDQEYDEATEAAVIALYESRGYVAQGLTDNERSAVGAATNALTDAQDRVAEAEAALDTALEPPGRAELLGLQNDVAQAEQMLTTAEANAVRNDAQAAAEVANRAGAVESAKAARAAAMDALAIARATGLDQTIAAAPDTATVPCDVTCIGRLEADVAAKDAAIAAAEADHAAAVANVAAVASSGAAEVANAERSLDLAVARQAEAKEPTDTDHLEKQVATAEAAAERAAAELAELEASTGTVVPSGEIVFVPTLPLRIDEVDVEVGESPGAGFVWVSGERLAVDSSVDAADADLVVLGGPVTIRVPGVDRTFTGTIAEIAETAGTDGVTGNQVYVRITPDDTGEAGELNGIGVVVTIPVESTGSEVLVVPIAAITARADRSTWVERIDADGTRSDVEVVVGLQADGLAEVAAAAGASLDEGDRVIVGTDSAAGTDDLGPDSDSDSDSEVSDG